MSDEPFASDDDQLHAWPAFVDLLAATAFVFIAFLAVYIYVAVTGEIGLRTQRLEIDSILKDAPGHATLFSIDPDSQFVRIVLKEAATFERGLYTLGALRPQGREALRTIGGLLAEPRLDSLFREVRVIGHSDQDAYPTPAYSNWELSASRAAVVARFLTDSVGLDPCRISAAGLGPYYPVQPPAQGRFTPAQKEQNRRIEIEIVPRRMVGTDNAQRCYERGDRR